MALQKQDGKFDGNIEPFGKPICSLEQIGTPPHHHKQSRRTLYEQAKTATRTKWLESFPRAERTMVQCDECQNKLRDLTWMADYSPGSNQLHPIYEKCTTHPRIFTRWISDLTGTINTLRVSS